MNIQTKNYLLELTDKKKKFNIKDKGGRPDSQFTKLIQQSVSPKLLSNNDDVNVFAEVKWLSLAWAWTLTDGNC